MKTIEVNDPVDCDVIIAADRATPSAGQARLCQQCGRETWAHTSACMWCGYDKGRTVLRWIVGISCVAAPVIFTLKLPLTVF